MCCDMHDQLSIREALSRHYAPHGLSPDGGAGRPYFFIRVSRLSIPALNPGLRKRALLAHDIHHLVTGYNTVFSEGEMIIAGHEIGAGCGGYVFAWLVNLWMYALGVFVTPRAMFAAFVRGRRSGSLYHHPRIEKDVREMTIADVRSLLRLDQSPPKATPARSLALRTLGRDCLAGPARLRGDRSGNRAARAGWGDPCLSQLNRPTIIEFDDLREATIVLRPDFDEAAKHPTFEEIFGGEIIYEHHPLVRDDLK